MKLNINKDVGVINVHTHPFTDEDCPFDEISDLIMARKKNSTFYRFFSSRFVQFFIPGKGIYDSGNRLNDFMEIFCRDQQSDMMNIENQLLKAVFMKIAAESDSKDLRNWLTQHPSVYHVGLLLKFSEAKFKNTAKPGRTDEQSYQLALNIAKEGPLKSYFTPGRGVDPRDPHMMEQVQQHWENGGRVYKFYPSLGFRVDDPRLIENFYPWVIEHGASIICHNSLGGFATLENPIDVKWLDDQDKLYECCQRFIGFCPMNWFKPKKRTYFSHPKNWEPVLNRFPDLKLDMAHFGGTEAVKKAAKGRKSATLDVIRLCEKFSNVKTDLSYTGFSYGISYSIKKVLKAYPFMIDRIMFGDDHSLVRMNSYMIPEIEAMVDMLLEVGEFEYVKKVFYGNAQDFLCN